MDDAPKVLIGCEESQVFQQAFEQAGFNAWSCDLQPTRGPSPNRHIRADVREVVRWDDWDLLVVLHPPCTRLCNSGVRWLTAPPKGKTLAQMWAELDEGAALFAACWQAPVPLIAVENPVMHRHARARLPADLPAPKIVQPWWFGDPAFKATGWYLAGLPGLAETARLNPPAPGSEEHRRWSRVHRMAPGPNRARDRSESFPGMAAAAAAQWGAIVREAVQRAA